ncbi:TetR family transcriptional regulator [Kribbella voronezhensis]|uniref:TetR family transcriptional regulator n=1 Tax=Kribbella voronezhensis TaxID=2512212 RepID=A0A4V3FKF3_9ACTN|nr:TetR/AcrR family transcriptional regulator [Kribbella voronezhensis]TDU89983.1 TetR family transcriptional regulator [Kribbella voronezhensis]
MPKLWNDTIEAHRNAVRAATLDAAADLVAEHGPAAVTMSQIAKATGIGRATLYKYFPDVDTILTAWHERQVRSHLDELTQVRDRADPSERLDAVLTAYAVLSYQHPRFELADSLHRAAHVSQARQHLHTLIRELLVEAGSTGDLRTDVPATELATYCLHALGAANALPSKAAVHRLVAVTLSGLRR